MEVCTKYQIIPDYTLMDFISYYIIKHQKRYARKGWNIMGDYRFISKDLGEVWDIEENNFLWNPSRWYGSIISYIKWNREHNRESCDDISFIECWHADRYYGMIAVSDRMVQWITHSTDPVMYRRYNSVKRRLKKK